MVKKISWSKMKCIIESSSLKTIQRMVSFFVLHNVKQMILALVPDRSVAPPTPLSSRTSPDIKTKLSFCSAWQEIFGNTFWLWKRFFLYAKGECLSHASVAHPPLTSSPDPHPLPSRLVLCAGKAKMVKNAVSPCVVVRNWLKLTVSGIIF